MRRLICKWRGHRWDWQPLEMRWEADGGGYAVAVYCLRCHGIATRKSYDEKFGDVA